MAELERLHKYLARAGVASRRKCEEMIGQGRVAVNGAVVSQPGVKIDPERDVVAVDGKKVAPPPQLVYIMLNKPEGFITTVSEQSGRPAVLDLLRDSANVFPPEVGARQKAERLKQYRLYPVGRLDINTEGLLIITNDGELTNRMTHPRFALEKEYVVQVKGRPAEEALNRLKEGVEIEGRLTAPAKVSLLKEEGGSTRLSVIIHEGRKRQVRLMLEAVGYPVQNLKRIRIGPLRLGSLPVGRYRFLAESEVKSLKGPVGLVSPPASRQDEKRPRRLQMGPVRERTKRKRRG